MFGTLRPLVFKVDFQAEKYINFVEDHTMSIPTKFDSN